MSGGHATRLVGHPDADKRRSKAIAFSTVSDGTYGQLYLYKEKLILNTTSLWQSDWVVYIIYDLICHKVKTLAVFITATMVAFYLGSRNYNVYTCGYGICRGTRLATPLGFSQNKLCTCLPRFPARTDDPLVFAWSVSFGELK